MVFCGLVHWMVEQLYFLVVRTAVLRILHLSITKKLWKVLVFADLSWISKTVLSDFIFPRSLVLEILRTQAHLVWLSKLTSLLGIYFVIVISNCPVGWCSWLIWILVDFKWFLDMLCVHEIIRQIPIWYRNIALILSRWLNRGAWLTILLIIVTLAGLIKIIFLHLIFI